MALIRFMGSFATPNTRRWMYPGSGNQTYATSINDAGQVAGVYFDASGVEHGFILDGLGNYTTIDVAGGILVTNAILSQNGEVAGTYEDANYIPHGYVRDTLGNVTSFDVVSGGGTYVWGINASGEIAGVAGDVFVRDASRKHNHVWRGWVECGRRDWNRG